LTIRILPRRVSIKPSLLIHLADHVEAHRTRSGRVAVARLLGELNAIVRQDRVDAVRHSYQQVFEELPCYAPVSLVDQLSDGELGG
jgi:hypothetical protein